MYFKVIMEGGHMGAGKSFEMLRYFEAENAIILLRYLENYPALKSKGSGIGISLVKPISRDEYLEGRDVEQQDPYNKMRLYVRFDVNEECLLESVMTDAPTAYRLIKGRTVNYSNDGLMVKHEGKRLSDDDVFLVTVESMGIFTKKAKVVWGMKDEEGLYSSGLKWI